MHRRPNVAPAVLLTDGTVLLRLAHDGDWAAVYSSGQDPDLAETAWLPVPFPCPREVAIRTVQEFQQGWQSRFGLTLVIATPRDDDLRGVLHLAARSHGVGEIAYGVAPPYRRQGVATRAVKLLTDWAFTQLGLTRLEIVVMAGGIYGLASRRVAEKAGFVYEATRRSHLPATGSTYDDPLYVLACPGAPGHART
jgi:RimJ/RimL family protein N-acetyltransferase